MGRGLPLRVLYAGTSDFAVPALQALVAAGAPPVAALTRPARPAGRGQRRRTSPLADAAGALHIPLLEPANINDPPVLDQLRDLAPDIMIVASYGQILRPPLLALPRRGCVNLHASLLPAWRGAAPVAHALLAGDALTGVSLMQMDAGLDTGPVLATRRTPITAADDRGRLTDRLARMAAELLVEHLDGMARGTLRAVPQDGAAASLAPMLRKSDGMLDWTRPAREIACRVRAFTPRPGAFTFAGRRRLLVRRVAEAAPELAPDAAPGTVAAAPGPDDAVAVRCGAGTALVLLTVQPEGRAAMPAAAAVRGRQLTPGQVLGPPAAD